MKRLLIASACIAALSACSDSDTARRALAQQGYTDIEITGYRPWGCGQDDTFSTGFVATSMAGHRVEGVVCSALFTKGATIRTF